ncbi:MAG: hypothetical protein ACKVPJ_09105 [Chitinophagales bacterium]
MNQKVISVMRIIHGSMIMGLLLFFIVLIGLGNGLPSGETDFNNPLVYVAIVFLVFALMMNYIVYPARIQKLKDSGGSATEKVNGWKTWFLIRCATTEAAALFCLVGVLLTDSSFYMYMYFAALVLFISYFPTKNKLQGELELRSEEMSEVG